MNRPFVGITMYGRDENDRFSLPTQYVDAVRRAGGIPLLLPPGEPCPGDLFERIDRLILAGGGDIDPSVYGGVAHETNYLLDADRDALEMDLARRAIATGLPTLCVCRGAQIVNVALGGSLHAHLPEVYGDRVTHRLPPREPALHPVRVDASSRLARVMADTEPSPVSWHHQAIDRLAPGLTVTASADDGVIEAFELDTHPWLLAVQWHPELSAAEDPTQQRLFDALVRAPEE